ncbi:MAG: hypothetical protein GEV07_05140 [Streptosporangiales bacterium]|nr:hypothetical protein [Streptosporangiales bacterium]
MANETPAERKARELAEVLKKREEARQAREAAKAREAKTKKTGDDLAAFHKSNPRWKPGKSR